MLNFADTGGLFDHYEVNGEPFWPKLMWLLGGSAAWHLVLVACVLLIPPVRDALSVAAIFSGADFVDRPYKRTAIGDDVDIIEFTTEKFRYPDGYFLMDNPGMQPLPAVPPAGAPFTPAYMPPVETPTTTPTPTPTPTPPPVIAGNTVNGKQGEAKPSPAKGGDDKSTDKAQQDLEAASKTTGIDLPQEGEINKAPFKDLATYATDLRDKGKLDFNKPFEVSIESTLNKDGALVNPIVLRKAGDETLVDLGKRLIEAMNDSGVLFYLKKLNEDKPNPKVIFTIKQDSSEVLAIVESEVTSADSANKLSRGFATMLTLGAASRKGHDEEILLKSTKVSAENNKIIFKLTMARQDVVDIVKKGMALPTPTVKPS